MATGTENKNEPRGKHAYAVHLGLLLIPFSQHGVVVADLRGAVAFSIVPHRGAEFAKWPPWLPSHPRF